jgi:hypothetical protein
MYLSLEVLVFVQLIKGTGKSLLVRVIIELLKLKHNSNAIGITGIIRFIQQQRGLQLKLLGVLHYTPGPN